MEMVFNELFVFVLESGMKLGSFEDHREGFVLFLKKGEGKGQGFLKLMEDLVEGVIRRIGLVHSYK